MGHVPTARRPSGLQAALAVQSECATLLTVRQPRREQQASPAQLCQRQTPPMPGVVRLLKTESTQAPETKRSPPRPGLHSPRPGASLKAAPPPRLKRPTGSGRGDSIRLKITGRIGPPGSSPHVKPYALPHRVCAAHSRAWPGAPGAAHPTAPQQRAEPPRAHGTALPPMPGGVGRPQLPTARSN